MRRRIAYGPAACVAAAAAVLVVDEEVGLSDGLVDVVLVGLVVVGVGDVAEVVGVGVGLEEGALPVGVAAGDEFPGSGWRSGA